jgi:uncharacterized membrane protein
MTDNGGTAHSAAGTRQTTSDALAKRLLRAQWDQLSTTERTVIESVLARITREEIISQNTNSEFKGSRSFGERMSDRIATFGGSWTFILLFMSFLVLWSVVNTKVLGPRNDAFDPYPYIFLNLLLSMIAALQAPVIMMSQNRAARRDRIEAKNDYGVNLKAELEIRELHEKLDLLRESQWAELVQMQREQIRLLEGLLPAAVRTAAETTG